MERNITSKLPMLLVNLYGVPCAGKSTAAAYIFSKLKMAGVNAELVTEFAKDKSRENNYKALKNQVYVFGNQWYRITRLQARVDVVVTDSPLLLSILYNRIPEIAKEFEQMVVKIAKSYRTLDFLLLRDKPYSTDGRIHTEEESDGLLEPLKTLLHQSGVYYQIVENEQSGYDEIVDAVLKVLQR